MPPNKFKYPGVESLKARQMFKAILGHQTYLPLRAATHFGGHRCDAHPEVAPLDGREQEKGGQTVLFFSFLLFA